MLRTAAEAARGTFISADANDKAGRVKSALANLRTQQRASVTGETRTPRFQWFLAPALLLLLLDTFLSERRGARRRRDVSAARRTATAAAVLLSVLGTGCARVKERTTGAREYNAGRFGEAALAYRRAIDAGDRSPTTLYNYGTSLLGADSLAGAAEALERVPAASPSEVRYRALFNQGLAHLKRGLALEGDQATGPLDTALAVYKQVLLLRHDDLDAKWNYELALRKKQSGGGGGGASNQSQAPSAPEREQPQPSGGLAERQAEQLLGSAAREERDVQAKRQRQNRVEPPPGGKDW